MREKIISLKISSRKAKNKLRKIKKMKPNQSKKKANKSNSLLSLCFSAQSIKQVARAGLFSFWGLKVLMKERAFVQELILFIIAIAFAFLFANNKIELVLLILSVGLIVLVEVINTAIEKTIDRIGAEIHPLSKAAKDIGSFAVFFSILIAIFVWISIIFIK